jgi:phosphonate transport system ATP-binding protein
VALSSGRIAYDGPATALDAARLVDVYGPEFHDAFPERSHRP